MSKVMLILGIVVTAAAVAVGLLVFFSPGQMQVLGVTPETAAILLVGGLVLIGIGAMIGALDRMTEATAELRRWLGGRSAVPGAQPGSVSIAVEKESGVADPSLRGASEPSAAEATVVVATATTAETIAALDKAKEDLTAAIDEEPPAEAEEGEEPADEGGEDQLYVIEERLIRGRPARVLSDGTVEAETDEGWMRFENREHLEEYLDAMSPDRS